jgi:Tfp pilus assembly protein PilF
MKLYKSVLFVFIIFLINSCGGPVTKTIITPEGKQIVVEEGKKTEEDLTVKKVEAPKEPEYVPGVDKDAQIAFKDGVLAVSKTPPDYASALKDFENAISEDKNFLEAYFNYAMVYERKGEPEKALEVYKKAIGAMPDNLDAKAYIGKIYLAKAQKFLKKGDKNQATLLQEEAKKIFDEIIQKDPSNITANNALALYWLMKGDLVTAEDFVKKVLSDQPKNVAGLNTRGLINLLNKNYKIAKWLFEEKALKEDPNSTEAMTNLGLVYVKTGNIPMGVTYFEKALELDPDNLPARMNLGAIYLNYLNYKAADEQYTYILKLEPDNLEATIGKGSSFYGLNKHKEAVEKYETALKMEPNLYILYKRLGDIQYKKLNDLQKAIDNYSKYIQGKNLPPNDPVVQTMNSLKQMLAGGLQKIEEEKPAPAPQPAPEGQKPAPGGQKPASEQPKAVPQPKEPAKDVKPKTPAQPEEKSQQPPVSQPVSEKKEQKKEEPKKVELKKEEPVKVEPKKEEPKKEEPKKDAAPAPLKDTKKDEKK